MSEHGCARVLKYHRSRVLQYQRASALEQYTRALEHKSTIAPEYVINKTLQVVEY